MRPHREPTLALHCPRVLLLPLPLLILGHDARVDCVIEAPCSPSH
jgi:hypothetical protein